MSRQKTHRTVLLCKKNSHSCERCSLSFFIVTSLSSFSAIIIWYHFSNYFSVQNPYSLLLILLYPETLEYYILFQYFSLIFTSLPHFLKCTKYDICQEGQSLNIMAGYAWQISRVNIRQIMLTFSNFKFLIYKISWYVTLIKKWMEKRFIVVSDIHLFIHLFYKYLLKPVLC